MKINEPDPIMKFKENSGAGFLKPERINMPNFKRIQSKEIRNFNTHEDPVGGAPGGACPGSTVSIEGSTCAPGTGETTAAVVDTEVDARAADATSGVVAEALFVIF